MDAMTDGDGAARTGELRRLEDDLEELRRVADHSAAVPAALLEPEVAEAVALLVERFRPREREERQMADTYGKGRLAGVIDVLLDQIEPRIGDLKAELAAMHENGERTGAEGRLARLLYEVGALVEAQLEVERWLIANAPMTVASEDAGAHCEWCGAEYPVPGT